MTPQFIIQASEWSLVILVCVAMLIGLAAFVYDIRTVSSGRKQYDPNDTNGQPRPAHVTVLVYARNNQATIEACLVSIRRSYYRRYDIVIIDDQSTDLTRRIVKRYQRRYPSESLYCVEKRKGDTRQQLTQDAYGISQKGEIVLSIDATAIVASTMLGESEVLFGRDQKLQALRLNETTDGIVSPMQLCIRLIILSHNVVMKSLSLFLVGRIAVFQPNTFYRKEIFETSNLGQKVPYRYQGSLSITNGAVDSTRFPIILSCIVTLFMTFFSYAAATRMTSSLLLFSWLLVIAWLALAVWSDEISRTRQKVSLSFCLPVMYFLLYGYLSIQIAHTVVRYVVRITSPLLFIRQEPIVATEHKL